MKPQRLFALLALALLALFLLAETGNASTTDGPRSAPVTPPLATATPCPPIWRTIPSPNGSGNNASRLTGVEISSPDDIWAVGAVGTNSHAIIQHWNGTQWTSVSYQAPGFAEKLNSVSVVSSSDVWAVGWYEGNTSGTLTEHWNGAYWAYIPSPNGTPSTWNELTGVSAIASNDVWAVGTTDGSGGTSAQTLIIHWNGTAWSLVESPSPGTGGRLNSVSAISTNDVWAVGTFLSGTTTRAMALHWDGVSWSQTPVPSFPADSALYGVEARGPGTIWAVGAYSGQTLILSWTNGNWNIVPSPNVGAEPNSLYGVTAIAPDEAWAVGKYKSAGSDRTLTMHWNGSTWSTVQSTNPELVNSLSAVSMLTSNYVWAVGLSNNEIASQGDTLVEHYSSPEVCLAVTPTDTPTATSEATATPTSCSVSYTYTMTESPIADGSLMPGNPTRVSSCQDCATEVRLPFAFDFYGHTYTTVSMQTYGNIQFTTANSASHTCPFPAPQMGPAIMPYWSEFQTYWSGSGDPCLQNYGVRCGIYTSITGSEPYRVYNIQWVGILFGSNHETVNFQARLYETTGVIDFVYASGIQFGSQGAVGVQDGADRYTAYACNTSANLQNIAIHFTPVYSPCVTGTPSTPTSTRTQTPTSTPTQTTISTPPVTSTPFVTDTPSTTGTPGSTNTPLATPTCLAGYSYSTFTDNLVQGVSLVAGSQCGHCIVPFALPFPITYYEQTYTSANLASYGNIQFVTAFNSTNSCPPDYPQIGPAIFPNWDDSMDMAQTNICQSIVGRPCGIYTSVSGTAPNRTLNIEWLARRSGSSTYIINFETRFYEATGIFDFVYGAIRPPGVQGLFSSIGIQDGMGRYISYACHVADSTFQGLLIRWYPVLCGPTPTPSPTNTPTVVPTATLTTPTNTPISTVSSSATASYTAVPPSTQTPIVTSTPTLCPISFSDVPPESAFYPFIRCLACRGAISGYADGTFRPGSDITRGQIAKIVSNAAGFSEDPGPQLYTDVAPTNTFYAWINRLSNRGFMGGYSCGSIPEEPCIAPGNLPYFRPLANATRGQLAKIVANAAGVTGEPAGLYYTDVPESNPFYLWIMRLTALGVMSGYDCGRPNEPCDSQNRPYFRPFANVTRGQASKIVANTFLPGCQTPQR